MQLTDHCVTVHSHILDLPKVKPIVEAEGEEGIKLIRLQAQSEDELPSETLEVLRADSKGTRKENITMGYENWNTCW